MTKRRSDLKKYIAARKRRDKSFANGYKSGSDMIKKEYKHLKVRRVK